ncbi:GLUG motif-containing protein, partial [Paenibacillus sp. TAF58]
TGLSGQLSGSEQIFMRYSDGSVSQAFDEEVAGQLTARNQQGKTIVGGYVTNGTLSWVPTYSYPFNNSVQVSGVATSKPTVMADHVRFAEPSVDGEYVNVTFAVYGYEGQLVDGRTEVFAHSTNVDLTFYNTDMLDSSNPMPPFNYTRTDVVKGGFSSYTVGGYVTFRIKSNLNDISSQPISLYSGSRLISNDPFRTGTNLVTKIEVGSDDGLSTLKAGHSIAMHANIQPVEATNQAFTWSVENGTGSATIDSNGLLTGISAGTVTVKAAALDGSAVFGTKLMTVVSNPGALNKGTGTINDPYQIANVDQLNEIRYHLNTYNYYQLTADITSFPDESWQPIGDRNTEFQGHMDGNGFKIKNLSIGSSINELLVKSGGSGTGLIGITSTDSVITNMILEDINIIGYGYTGGLVGYNKGTISYSSAAGSVNSGSNLGGLVGYNHENGTISNSFSSVNVNGSTDIGGLVGNNDGTISSSYATGSVTSTYNQGGLAGNNYGTITDSYATGSVSGYYGVGGLVSFNNGTISNSLYAMGFCKQMGHTSFAE